VPWEYCPRSALKKVLESVEGKYGITFVIGQEIEFYLLEVGILEEVSKRKVPAPVDTSLYCQTWALDGVATLLDDICEAVEACSIPVEQVHAESGPGQFELATAPGIGNPPPPHL
jgi:glutamine synthetase